MNGFQNRMSLQYVFNNTRPYKCSDNDILCIPKWNRNSYLYQRPQLRLNDSDADALAELFEKMATHVCPNCGLAAGKDLNSPSLTCTTCNTTYHEHCIGMNKYNFHCPLCTDPEVSTIATSKMKSRFSENKKATDAFIPNMGMHEWNNDDQLNSYNADFAAVTSEAPELKDLELNQENLESECDVDEKEVTVEFRPKSEGQEKKAKGNFEVIKHGFEKLHTSNAEVTIERIFQTLQLNPWLDAFLKQKIKAPDLLLLTESDYENLLPIGPRRRLQAWLLGLRLYALKS